ncbi:MULTISPECIES: CopG family antitoxin [Planktothricoides]|uniref:Antitoxin n=2 Tax=Planktothricoides raciborskii TaxID=132608 RepID=A0ABR8ECN4_9CYAN|nr:MULTISPECIES: CopG family antitoxin [Planktothricoides]KOR38190.1 antitoxin [Planktothricoides sp. SR001]MBD2544478.1 antitoxin [Planktothricoides raciborskii FACHB-1370]MBD2585958.1 antitoxin [Planktothricoides raciborskii FACHB-1261]
MEPEYDLSKMKKRPNPFAKQLKKQVTLSVGIDVIEYFEMMAQEKGISYQELINLYLQDCVTSGRKLSVN